VHPGIPAGQEQSGAARLNTSIRTFRVLIITAICAVLTFGIYATGATHEGHGTPAASPAASPSASPVASPAASTVLELKTGDMKFAPKQFTMPANTDVTLRITNKGMLPHDVTITGTTYATPKIASGDTVELVLNLPPGSYQFFCTVPGHKQAGMIGTIVVE
jgi:uncharacterized cupredoxin-like copper-binding protein